MLEQALVFLRDQLNNYFQSQGLEKDKVVLSSVTNQKGEVAISDSNKVIMTLVRVEEETVIKNGPWNRSGGDSTIRTNPPVNLNLIVLFAAYFDDDNYNEALKWLSRVVGYFQSNMAFDHQSYPNLDPNIARLWTEIYEANFHDLNHIWGMIGAKFMPSMLYKVRMVTLDSDTPISITPVIQQSDSNPATT